MNAERSAWSPLRIALFRSLWIATIVSNIGTWMQDVGSTRIVPRRVAWALGRARTVRNSRYFRCTMNADDRSARFAASIEIPVPNDPVRNVPIRVEATRRSVTADETRAWSMRPDLM